MDNFGFLKVAAAVPHVRVADCDYNTERMAVSYTHLTLPTIYSV